MSWFAYRVASGHISKATLQGSDSYLLREFPKQSDQTNHVWLWLIPQINDSAIQVKGLVGTKTQGSPNAQLVFPSMSTGMLAYWNSQIFTSSVPEAEATIQIPNVKLTGADYTAVYQVSLIKPTDDELGQSWNGQFFERVAYSAIDMTLL